MRKAQKVVLWVVYKMTVTGKVLGVNAVCEQGEWDTMERERPGYHTLVWSGIATESEAERLARVGTHAETATRICLKPRPGSSIRGSSPIGCRL